jgi:pimeloyl-ACP methyl ester carboxylesterase
MPYATSGSIELYYETSGADERGTVMMIAGLGNQLIHHPPAWIRGFTDAGFRVVTFDNRDAGLSTCFDDHPVDVMLVFARLVQGLPVSLPYRLQDMATDVVAVMDAVDVDRAHLVGISMGGMIAQTVAFTRPDRVASLTSIMSTTGDPTVGNTSQQMSDMMLQGPPANREEAIRRTLDFVSISWGRHYDEERARRTAELAYDRAHHPEGAVRQLAAVLADGDRTARLGGVTAPTLVIHGEDDPFVSVTGGEASAEAIPDARLVRIPTMGHDLPPALIDELNAHVLGHIG